MIDTIYLDGQPYRIVSSKLVTSWGEDVYQEGKMIKKGEPFNYTAVFVEPE